MSCDTGKRGQKKVTKSNETNELTFQDYLRFKKIKLPVKEICCEVCGRENQKIKDKKYKRGWRWKLKLCKGCGLVYYCSRKCQKIDWNKRNHRRICDMKYSIRFTLNFFCILLILLFIKYYDIDCI